jgi:hypothetical protein
VKDPIEGRCNAKKRSGDPCTQYPVAGRKRCRMHGGATPRGRDSVHFKHGLDSRYMSPEDLVGELTQSEEKRMRELQAMTTSKVLSERLAVAVILQDRAIAHGDGALPSSYGVVIASMARAKIMADRDRGAGVADLPQFIEVFEGKTRDDFRREHQDHTRRVLETVTA